MSRQKYPQIFRKILQILPQTTVSSLGHVDFLILDGGEHGEHGGHVHPHPISQRHQWLREKVASKNIHKNIRLIWRQKRFCG